eukprot:scaffold40080_cov56-Phaeocystis_antarctica.AAC.2
MVFTDGKLGILRSLCFAHARRMPNMVLQCWEDRHVDPKIVRNSGVVSFVSGVSEGDRCCWLWESG